MAITLQTLRDYLNQAGIKHDVDDDKEMAYFMVSTDDDELGRLGSVAFVTLQEGGEFIQVRAYLDKEKVPQEAVKNSPHQAALLKHLMHLHYRRKIGRWSFDPSDGDLYVDHGLPVEDNDKVTFKQFERVRNTVIKSALEATADIKRLVETGTAEKLDPAPIILEAINLAVSTQKMDLVTRLATLDKASLSQSSLLKLKAAVDSKDVEALAGALAD